MRGCNRTASLSVLAVAVALLMLAACGGVDPTPPPTPAQQATTPTSQATTPASDAQKAAWEVERDELLKQAQAEGTLQGFFCCAVGAELGKYIGEFEEKYGIKVVFSGGSSLQQAPKTLAEQNAGQYTLDVWMGGLNPALPQFLPAEAIIPLKPMLFFPEVLDESNWFQGRLHWYDQPQREHVLGFRGNASGGEIAYNTNLVNPDEITSYWDLLDPKWKGKIIIRDPRDVGSSGSTVGFYLTPGLGEEWLRRLLTETDVTIVQQERQAAELLASGEYAFCMFACSGEVRSLKQEGLPVENEWPGVLKEGGRISPGGGALYVMKNPPHPSAAKFFVNWWLSREGQIMHQQATGDNSLRIDIPKDDVFPENRAEEGVEYLMLGSQPDYDEQLEKALAVARDALASVGK